MSSKNNVTSLILAGGEARRMGGTDKALVEIKEAPMIEYIIKALRPQTDNIIINANRNIDTYKKYTHEIISDELEGYQGPLAGMLSGLKHCQTDYLFTAPCDSPLCPTDIVERMYNNLLTEKAEISVVHDGNRMHPVFCLLHKTLTNSLSSYLESGKRKIDHWFSEHSYSLCDFSDKPNAFLNINTLEDIALIEKEL